MRSLETRIPDDHQCDELSETGGWCTRTGTHITHQATGAAGNIIKRWKIRRVEVEVPPDQLTYGPLGMGS